MGTFAISLKENGEYRYTYNNRRGKTIITSVSYKTIEECYENIEVIKKEIDQIFFLKLKTTSGKFYFKLSLNETIICVSRKFTTVLRIEKAIMDIKTHIKNSETLDFTSYSFPEINFDNDNE
jgi:uncharacterized protein